MIVLITGTTSGIGKALVSGFLRNQHHVILISRPGPATDRQQELLAEGLAVGSFRHFPCDLSEPFQVIQTCDALKRQYKACLQDSEKIQPVPQFCRRRDTTFHQEK